MAIGLKLLSNGILTFWVAYIFLFIGGAFVFPSQFSISDKTFYFLTWIYIGCFPLMLALAIALWNRNLERAKVCLLTSIILGAITLLSWPSVA